MEFSHRFLKFLEVRLGKLRSLFMHQQFVRFVLVGIGNTMFSYGVYAALLLIGLEYPVASLLSLLLGIAFSFTTHSNVVFRNATRITFAKFVVAWMVIYVLNISIIALLMRTSIGAYWAGAIATVPVTLVSYFALKFAVFGHREPTQSTKPPK